jgi:putative oxidoreductase
MLEHLLRTDADWTLTAARLVLGIVLFAHGAQKALGWFGGPGLQSTLDFFKSHLKIPESFAFLAIAAELLGGLGLIFGFLSRLDAFAIADMMLVAMIMVHARFGLFMNWLGDRKGHGVEYHLLAIALSIVIIIQGGGAMSMDRALMFANHSVDSSAATQPMPSVKP